MPFVSNTLRQVVSQLRNSVRTKAQQNTIGPIVWSEISEFDAAITQAAAKETEQRGAGPNADSENNARLVDWGVLYLEFQRVRNNPTLTTWGELEPPVDALFDLVTDVGV